jgi:hypothetical protein
LDKLPQEIPIFLYDFKNFIERHSDGLGLLKRHRTVLTRIFGSTELTHNVPALSDIIDELVAIPSDRPNLYKSAPQEEPCLVFVANIVEDLVFFNSRNGAISQHNIAELPSKDYG